MNYTKIKLVARRLLNKFFLLRCLNLVMLNITLFLLYNHQQSNTLLEWDLNPLTNVEVSPRIKNPFLGVSQYIQYATKSFKLEPLRHVKPLLRDVGNVINDVNYTYLDRNSTITCQGDVKLLVVAISAPGNFLMRQLVRKTWGGQLQSLNLDNSTPKSTAILKSELVFLVGKSKSASVNKKIEEENHLHHDLIRVDLIDSYQNLTLKSIALLDWTHKYCSKTRFVLKVDDDIYLNIEKLNDFLQNAQANGFGSKAVIFGKQLPTTNAPVREKHDKSYISYDAWPWTTYPPYIFGGTYLLTKKAISKLIAAAQVVPLLNFEDLYIVGLCAARVGVEVMVSNRFLAPRPLEDSDLVDPCIPQYYIAWESISATQFVNSHIIADAQNEIAHKC